MKFNRLSRALLRWIATPFVAVGGFGLGIVACSALQGAIAFFNFVPFVPNLLWLSGAATTYFSASLSSSFAVSCAPSMQQKVRWIVLVAIFIYQLLQVFSIPAAEKSVQNWFGAYAIEGFVVISWLMFKAWKKPL